MLIKFIPYTIGPRTTSTGEMRGCHGGGNGGARGEAGTGRAGGARGNLLCNNCRYKCHRVTEGVGDKYL